MVREKWCKTDGGTGRQKKWHIEVGAAPNNSDSCLEMSALSNFNILVGAFDLWESNENMTFSISILSVGLTRKGNIRSVFKKIWKMFMWKWNL